MQTNKQKIAEALHLLELGVVPVFLPLFPIKVLYEPFAFLPQFFVVVVVVVLWCCCSIEKSQLYNIDRQRYISVGGKGKREISQCVCGVFVCVCGMNTSNGLQHGTVCVIGRQVVVSQVHGKYEKSEHSMCVCVCV